MGGEERPDDAVEALVAGPGRRCRDERGAGRRGAEMRLHRDGPFGGDEAGFLGSGVGQRLVRLGPDPDVRATGRTAGPVARPVDEQQVADGEGGEVGPLVPLPDAGVRAEPELGPADVRRLFRVALVIADARRLPGGGQRPLVPVQGLDPPDGPVPHQVAHLVRHETHPAERPESSWYR